MSKPKATSSKQAVDSPKPLWESEQEADVKTPVYFWRPHDDWGVFGQWYMCEMTDEESGITFQCCEQFMMYQKAIAFKDDEIAKQIMETSDPRRHKALGQKVSGFSGQRWDEIKFGIVVRANMLKFAQGLANKDDTFVSPTSVEQEEQGGIPLRTLLLSTGERELVEASPLDRIWGIGYSPAKAASIPRAKWGQNLLGKALMEVRDRLKGDAQPKGLK